MHRKSGAFQTVEKAMKNKKLHKTKRLPPRGSWILQSKRLRESA